MSSPTRPATAPVARRSQAVTLRRLTVVVAVLFVLALADALYMQFANYQQGTYNNFHLTDAATMFFAAGFLAVIAVALAVLARRAARAGR